LTATSCRRWPNARWRRRLTGDASFLDRAAAGRPDPIPPQRDPSLAWRCGRARRDAPHRQAAGSGRRRRHGRRSPTRTTTLAPSAAPPWGLRPPLESWIPFLGVVPG
jgi:hypothetical protein